MDYKKLIVDYLKDTINYDKVIKDIEVQEHRGRLYVEILLLNDNVKTYVINNIDIEGEFDSVLLNIANNLK